MKTMGVSGIIFDIRRFCLHDGPGIRSTVFFKGCPLDCCWCHNPEARGPNPEMYNLTPAHATEQEPREALVGSVTDVDTVVDELLRDRPFYDQSGGGVTFSGGEPTAQPEFLEGALRACKEHGLHTAVDTCGYAPIGAFERICELTDLFLFDLKLMDSQAHSEYTGMPNDKILANLIRLAKLSSSIWIRVPLVPEITDTEDNLNAIAEFLSPLKSVRRIHLLPYNKLGEDKIARYQLSRRNLNQVTQTHAELTQKAERLTALGFEVKIGG